MPVNLLPALPTGKNFLSWIPSGGGDVRTWAEVMQVIDSINSPLDIWLKLGEIYNIPANSLPYNMKNSRFMAILGSNCDVNIENGATLLDCAGCQGPVVFIGNSTNPLYPSFDYSLFATGASAAVFLGQYGGYLRQLGTSPMVIVPDNNFFVFAEEYGGGIDSGSIPGQEIIRLGNFCVILITQIGVTGQYTANCITGPASANMGIQHDGCGIAPTPIPNFLGNIFNIAFGRDGGAGVSAFRPLPIFSPLIDGLNYWDTTVNKALWWGTPLPPNPPSPPSWMDSFGIIVP